MTLKLFRPVKGDRNKDWRLTQKYGDNFKIGGKRMYGDIVKEWNKHEGLDYAGPVAGQSIPIYSCTGGYVHFAGLNGGFGNTVIIRFDGYEIVYAHLAKIEVSVNDTVKPMQLIGKMGSTGNSTAIHLHLGLRPIGKWWVDPTPYICDWETPKSPEYQNLIDDGIFNGDIGKLDERMLVIISRVYNQLKNDK